MRFYASGYAFCSGGNNRAYANGWGVKKNGVVLASPESGIGCAYPMAGACRVSGEAYRAMRRVVCGVVCRVVCGSGAGGLRVCARSWAGACRHALGRARGNRRPVLCMWACTPMYANVCGHARTQKGERESGCSIRHSWKTFANHGDYTHGAIVCIRREAEGV